jgi:hypothetical protein
MFRRNDLEGKDRTGEHVRKTHRERIADDTRELVNMLTLTKQFAESSVGAGLLQLFGLRPENIDVIFDNEGFLRTCIRIMSEADKKDMLGGAFYFFRLLAIKNPELYRECLKGDDCDSGLKKILRNVN